MVSCVYIYVVVVSLWNLKIPRPSNAKPYQRHGDIPSLCLWWCCCERVHSSHSARGCHIFNYVCAWSFVMIYMTVLLIYLLRAIWFLFLLMRSVKGLGYSPDGRVLALPHSSWVWAPELPCKMLGIVLHACNPSAWKAEMDGFLGPALTD